MAILVSTQTMNVFVTVNFMLEIIQDNILMMIYNVLCTYSIATIFYTPVDIET